MNGERQKKILIVDDDPTIVRMLKRILEKKGFDTIEAFAGSKVNMIAKHEKPDLVLLDVLMPDMDGFEVCKTLKLEQESKEIPVVFVTAKTAPENIRKGLSLGASGYVTKPFDTQNLMKAIEKALAGPEPRRPTF